MVWLGWIYFVFPRVLYAVDNLCYTIAGGFVVGQDGLGYTDIGEEIEWVNEDARQEEKKNKAKKGAAGAKKRAVRDEEPVSGAKERMQKMFQTAALKAKVPATRPKAAPKVNVAETDALLDDILGDLDSPSTNISSRTCVFAFLCVYLSVCVCV